MNILKFLQNIVKSLKNSFNGIFIVFEISFHVAPASLKLSMAEDDPKFLILLHLPDTEWF